MQVDLTFVFENLFARKSLVAHIRHSPRHFHRTVHNLRHPKSTHSNDTAVYEQKVWPLIKESCAPLLYVSAHKVCMLYKSPCANTSYRHAKSTQHTKQVFDLYSSQRFCPTNVATIHRHTQQLAHAVAVNTERLRPRLYDTAGCPNGCSTGWTAGCIV